MSLSEIASQASCLPVQTQIEIACAVGSTGVFGKAPSKKLLAKWQAKVKETQKQRAIVSGKIDKDKLNQNSDAEIRAANKSLAPNVKNIDPLSAKEYALWKSPAVKVEENIDEAGTNASYFVDLKSGSKGVFKPCQGSSDPNVGCLNEVLAYKMDKKLGLNLVPETIIKPVRIGKEDVTGSFQRKIENATEAYKGRDIPQSKELVKQQIFDKIIGNQDIDVSLGDLNRNSSNYLISKTGKVTSIDHGLAFHPEYKITNLTPEQRTFLKSVKGQRVTQKLKKMLSDDTSEWMKKYINPAEAERFKKRIEFILSQL